MRARAGRSSLPCTVVSGWAMSLCLCSSCSLSPQDAVPFLLSLYYVSPSSEANLRCHLFCVPPDPQQALNPWCSHSLRDQHRPGGSTDEEYGFLGSEDRGYKSVLQSDHEPSLPHTFSAHGLLEWGVARGEERRRPKLVQETVSDLGQATLSLSSATVQCERIIPASPSLWLALGISSGPYE